MRSANCLSDGESSATVGRDIYISLLIASRTGSPETPAFYSRLTAAKPKMKAYGTSRLATEKAGMPFAFHVPSRVRPIIFCLVGKDCWCLLFNRSKYPTSKNRALPQSARAICLYFPLLGASNAISTPILPYKVAHREPSMHVFHWHSRRCVH